MSDLYWALGSIWSWIGAASFVIWIVWIVYGVGRAGWFIAEVAIEPEDGRFGRAIKRAGGICTALLPSDLLASLNLLVAFPGRRFRAARYYVELQILQPPPALPDRRDYEEHEYTRRLDVARGKKEERDKTVRALLRERLDQDPTAPAAAFRWGLRRLGWMSGEEKPQGPVRVTDFPQVDDSRKKIKRYFDALDHRSKDWCIVPTKSDDPDRFLTEAKFESGYIAPIFLVTGLLNRFADEDGWELILDHYRGLIEQDTAYSKELRELRSFLFNCWLLWGPSIQPCSCGDWKAQHPAPDGDLMIQYGYGDENNSIDIRVKGGLGPDFLHKVKAILNEHAADHRDKPYNCAAAPFTATGRFRWGPKLTDAEVCDVQRLVQGGQNAARRQPLNGRVIIECRHGDVESVDRSKSSGYYSAYLWIMFLILDAEGRCFHDERWKNLLVFFEHANIADAATYHTLKEQLVAKTCTTLSKVLSEADAEYGPTPPLRLRYACSFDDTNCGKGHKGLFHPEKLERRDGVGFEEVTIISILRRSIDALPEGHVLRSPRLELPPETGSTEVNLYSSCRLPGIVEEFYGDLEDQMTHARNDLGRAATIGGLPNPGALRTTS